MRELKVGNVTLGPYERQNILQVMTNNWVSPGPFVAEFEQKFSGYHDSQFGVMVNSGTDALRIALMALKEKYHWRDGAQVIVPALTFVATVNIVLQCNLQPIFVDVNPKDLNMDVEKLGKSLTLHTVAIIPVHLFGNPCRMAEICGFARAHGLKVLEDSCEAMGVRSGDRMVGAWGDIGAFSTYSCHLIQTGVGGIAITNDEELYDLMRSYMNHGRRSEAKEDRFVFERIGFSCRPDEFQAAIGVAQLHQLYKWIDKRNKNAIHLSTLLTGAMDALWTLPISSSEEMAWMMFPVVLNRASMDRTRFCDFLSGKGIETRPLFPLLTQPCHLKTEDAEKFPVALKAQRQGFYVGCHQELNEQDMSYIADALLEGVHKFSSAEVIAA